MNLPIDGITYEVIGQKEIQPGRVELELRRPKGRRSYFAVRYENGALSGVV